jgi:hypothetical protein
MITKTRAELREIVKRSTLEKFAVKRLNRALEMMSNRSAWRKDCQMEDFDALAEERNHREKLGVIANTAAKQRDEARGQLVTEKAQAAELLSGMAAQRDAAIRDGATVCAKLDGVRAELAEVKGRLELASRHK